MRYTLGSGFPSAPSCGGAGGAAQADKAKRADNSKARIRAILRPLEQDSMQKTYIAFGCDSNPHGL
jgi:hypothetical protein